MKYLTLVIAGRRGGTTLMFFKYFSPKLYGLLHNQVPIVAAG